MFLKINLGLFIFNDVEILDFTGPYEVFSATRYTSKTLTKNNIEEIYKTSSPFNVFTISEKQKSIITKGGLKVTSDYIFSNNPVMDILIIPGGIGTRKLINNKKVISWIKQQENIKLIASVCTGSLLLGAAGLLRHKKASTHWSAESLLKKISPTTKISKKRYTIDKIYTSAGVASGIDLSLKIVEKFFGKRITKNTQRYMEYNICKK